MLPLGCGGGSLSGSNTGTSPTPAPPTSSTPAPTAQLTAAPASITAGQPVTLTWSTTNATSVTIDNGVGAVAASGSTTVKPSASVTYTLTATGSGGTLTATAAVTVTAPAPGSPTAQLTASQTNITAGQSVTLTWSTTNATSVSIDNGIGIVKTSGSTSVPIFATVTYTLTATGPAGTTPAIASVTITVTAPAAPAVQQFIATPTSVNVEQPVTLTWTTTNATSVTIDNGIGTGPASGAATTKPLFSSVIYTLTATGPGGTATATVAVTVTAPNDVTAVNHIIYILQENRSFDSYFGDLGTYRQVKGFGSASDIDGRPATASNNANDGTAIASYHFKSSCMENATPDWLESHGDYNFGNPGSNTFVGDGFVSNAQGLAQFEGQFSSADGQDPNSLPASGSLKITPTETANYYLFAKTSSGATQGTALASLLIQTPTALGNGETPHPASITPAAGVTFSADITTTTAAGQVVTLTWNAPGASGVFISTWYDQEGLRAMGFYNDQDLPYYYFMASAFATSDRWFSPLSSNSEPNRTYILSATTHGHVHDPGSFCSDASVCGSSNLVKNIFQLLDAAGITWKVYYQSIDKNTGQPLTRLSRYQPFAENHADHVVPNSQYFTDLQNGTLPQVAYIEENSGLDEHPGGTSSGDVNSGNNIQAGQQFAAQHINALMNSNYWKDSVFFLSWDEGGGLYDHVSPQPAVSPDNIAPMDLEPKDMQFINPPADFNRTGFRVPLIVVSPFTNKSFVSHTVRDYTAILKFIEMRFNLPSLTARDAAQADMLEFFNFAAPPWETPPTSDQIPVPKVTLPCTFTQLR